jgi:hypothetical protein
MTTSPAGTSVVNEQSPQVPLAGGGRLDQDERGHGLEVGPLDLHHGHGIETYGRGGDPADVPPTDDIAILVPRAL